jgi:hypothetical protein
LSLLNNPESQRPTSRALRIADAIESGMVDIKYIATG